MAEFDQHRFLFWRLVAFTFIVGAVACALAAYYDVLAPEWSSYYWDATDSMPPK